MKILVSTLALALAGTAAAATHPFDAKDLVMMDRVGAPVVSPDGKTVAFTVRSTDWDANKGRTSLWTVPVNGGDPRELVGHEPGAGDPHWSANGDSIYFLAGKDGTTQLWRVAASGGAASAVSALPLDINGYQVSPDGKQILLSLDVFNGCDAADIIACTKQKLDARAEDKSTAQIYDRMFVRHWDTWMDGRRSQLFIADLGADGTLGAPRLISDRLDGDIPSKPFGGESEFVFSPDGKAVYFDVRIAGTSEPWSTNFDVYAVPADGSAPPRNLTAGNLAWDANPLPSPDGKTLYYLAMKVPGFEADRFGIMALDLASGHRREINPDWDRSPGAMQLSRDGKTLYATANDNGANALFAIDVRNGKARRLTGAGTVTGFDIGGKRPVIGWQGFKHPTDLYRLGRDGKTTPLTRFNAERLKDIAFGDAEWFDFKGWNDDTVHGFVMKPVGYQQGKKYPVAFIIHGGPQGAMNENFHYRWNPETYAGQGFAVVTINFHGSTGYGQAFTDAISGHWGDRPLEDLQKGWAAALAKYPFLDGNRACALGASYGGFMTYWIAGVWNQPWKCLIDHDGVFDTRMMYYATEELWFEEHENGGTQYEHPANYEKFNPLDHVKDWRVPMLVIHSQHDYRIPLSQGLGAFTALQRRGIPSQLLYFPDENHWVNKPHNSLKWHETVNAWLKRWTAEK
ncbi:MAG TPA: S9 family peptidase [Rhodanobacteraceae bacterium]|nr:S9 family peptidase [Rhodanobacteraceae bacterium]